MVGGFALEKPRRLARELVQRFGVEAPTHVNVAGFAVRLGFKISVVTLSGALAQLVAATGRRPQILLSDRLTDPVLVRFTLAHEIGHYLLRHPSPSIAEMYDPTQMHSLTSHLGSVYEEEANAFARELLMHEPLVRMACDVTPASLDPALRIAYTFGVSVPTAAIRLVELTNLGCTVVLSEDGLVRWSAPNPAFPGHVAFRRQIDQRSLAWSYFDRGTLCPGVEHVPPAAWLDEPVEGPLLEHSIASHERGTVLTLLSIPSHKQAHLAA